MPLYEYKCLTCGSSFEVLQKVDEPRLKKCPKCGNLLKKVLSPPALQFKGSGWYITDYARSEKPEKESNVKNKPEKEKTDASEKKKGSSSLSTE
jgi:putative FmdB family regulatory protein